MKTKATKIILFFFLLLIALASAPMASADDFSKEQSALFSRGNDHFLEMSNSLEKVLDAYIAADGNIYWNDSRIKEPYKKYLSSLAYFSQTFEEMWVKSNRTFSNDNQRFRKASRGVKKKCLAKALSSKKLALNSFRGGKISYRISRRTRYRVTDESVLIANLVFQGDSNITDGYVDDAIYDFGTGYIIAPPPGVYLVEVDPEKLDPLIDEIYNYSSDTNGLYFSGFHNYFQKAIKSAQRAKAKKSCIR